jgi:hypothetical protein
MSHIFEQDNDLFRQEHIGDIDSGLQGDLSEEDILDLMREKQHEPHLGIVLRNPHLHPLNEKPNDYLSPYVVEGEVLPATHHHHHHNSHQSHH